MGSYGVSGWEQALQPFQSCVKKTGPHRAATWRNSLFLSLFLANSNVPFHQQRRQQGGIWVMSRWRGPP